MLHCYRWPKHVADHNHNACIWLYMTFWWDTYILDSQNMVRSVTFFHFTWARRWYTWFQKYCSLFVAMSNKHRIIHGLSWIKNILSQGRRITIDFHDRLASTVVKQCTFHWLISSELVQKQRVFKSLIIHHLIIITRISCGNIFAILVPKCINIAPLQTWVICVTVSDRICYTYYTGLKWSNINEFW